jgi:hypothetical protein
LKNLPYQKVTISLSNSQFPYQKTKFPYQIFFWKNFPIKSGTFLIKFFFPVKKCFPINFFFAQQFSLSKVTFPYQIFFCHQISQKNTDFFYGGNTTL